MFVKTLFFKCLIQRTKKFQYTRMNSLVFWTIEGYFARIFCNDIVHVQCTLPIIDLQRILLVRDNVRIVFKQVRK